MSEPKRSPQFSVAPPETIAEELHERLVELMGHGSDPVGEIDALRWALTAESLQRENTTPLLAWSPAGPKANQAVIRTDAGTAMVRLVEEVGLPTSSCEHDLMRAAFIASAQGDGYLARSLVLRIGRAGDFHERDRRRHARGEAPAGWQKLHDLFNRSKTTSEALLNTLPGLFAIDALDPASAAPPGRVAALRPFSTDRAEFLLRYFYYLARRKEASLDDARLAIAVARFLYEAVELETIDELWESVHWGFYSGMHRIAHARAGEESHAAAESLVCILYGLRPPFGANDVRSHPKWPDPFRWLVDDAGKLNDLAEKLIVLLASPMVRPEAREFMSHHLKALDAELNTPGRTRTLALRRRAVFLTAVFSQTSASASAAR